MFHNQNAIPHHKRRNLVSFGGQNNQKLRGNTSPHQKRYPTGNIWPPMPVNNHKESSQIAKLRILATTDVHMQLTGYDYIQDRPGPGSGFAGIATLIHAARKQAQHQGRGCILVDNGDILQGTALADQLAQQPAASDHALVACLNDLKYDAIGLGNHDFDYGNAYLMGLAQHLNMPLVSSNLCSDFTNYIKKVALIDCPLPSTGSPPRHIKVGLISVLPEQTGQWNKPTLPTDAYVTNPVKCVSHLAPILRQQGADLVVVMAHMGIGTPTCLSDGALPLAKIPGVDAIITGHTHRRFPANDHHGRLEVNAKNGTIAGCPAVMPGFVASDLGVLDLTITQTTSGWQVTGHNSELRHNSSETLPDPNVIKATNRAHNSTRYHLTQDVGETPIHLHTYFSLLMPTPAATILANAQAMVVRDALQSGPWAHLPILASSAAYAAGGHDGVENYLHIPKGRIQRRHITGLIPYNNQIWAAVITTSQLIKHLEQSASIYNQINPSNTPQPLLNTEIPAFNFDTIYGVKYDIEPSAPIGHRIQNLTYNQKPVSHDQRFVLATNQFRASGGGGYEPVRQDQIILRSPVHAEHALISALNEPRNTPWPDRCSPWRLTTPQPVTIEYDTSPAALPLLHEVAHLSPSFCRTSQNGYARLQLTLQSRSATCNPAA